MRQTCHGPINLGLPILRPYRLQGYRVYDRYCRVHCTTDTLYRIPGSLFNSLRKFYKGFVASATDDQKYPVVFPYFDLNHRGWVYSIRISHTNENFHLSGITDSALKTYHYLTL